MKCPYCQQEKHPYGTDTYRCYECNDSIFWVDENQKIITTIIREIKINGTTYQITMDAKKDPYTTVCKISQTRLPNGNPHIVSEKIIELNFIPNWTPQNLPEKLKLYLWFL